MKKIILFSAIVCMLFFLSIVSKAQAPNWYWAKSAGGSNYDAGLTITTDANNNIIVTGIFKSSSITFGTTTLLNTNPSFFDIFIVKYDPFGNVLWAKKVGGSGEDETYGITVDAKNNIIITGYFESPKIGFGTDTLINVNPGTPDIFVAKYDPNGNVIWAKGAYGSSLDISIGVVTDANNHIIISGYFESPYLVFGTDTLVNNGTSNIFITKYDSTGNVIWTCRAGGGGFDEAFALAVDGSNNIAITGWFNSPILTAASDTLFNANPGTNDVFTVKCSPSGNVLWAKNGIGNNNDWSFGIIADVEDVIITGQFSSSTITFGPYTLINSSPGNVDAFIVKYDNIGNVIWAQRAGGTYNDCGNSIAKDPNHDIILTGDFNSPSIIFGTDTLYNSNASNTTDIFIVEYDNSGNVIWTKKAGGNGNDYVYYITSDGNDNIILTGRFESPFIVFGLDSLYCNGGGDVFTAKLKDSSIITGMANSGNSYQYNIFPNPASENFQIQTALQIMDIEITDITGRLLYTTTSKTIDCSSFAKGIYFIRIETGKGVVIKKFLKE